jgi:hypothetical protein
MQVRTVDGVCYGPVQSISVGASPFTWVNPEACPVLVSVTGGTLSVVQLSPDVGVTWMDVGLTCGQYRLNPGWQIKVTYLVIPGTMAYTPV